MKKKILIVALVVCLMVMSITSATIAYFTDTEQYSNTFTTGNVYIDLTTNGETTNESDFKISGERVYPGLIINKDVTITNVGTEEAFAGAIITLTDDNGDLATIISETGGAKNIPVALTNLLTKLGVGNCAMKVVNIMDTVDTTKVVGYTIYIINSDPLAAGTGVWKVFEQLAIPASWDNTQMDAFEDMTLSVKAYAVQTAGFEGNAANAIKAAFGGGADSTNGAFAGYFN